MEKVLIGIESKNKVVPIHPINKLASDAQLPYKTLSMKEFAQNGIYSGAPKYLKQRDSLLEIPIDCVRKLCDAIDQDCSDLVQLKHLKKYVEKCELPFDEGIVEKMFEEASQGRGQISEEKK